MFHGTKLCSLCSESHGYDWDDDSDSTIEDLEGGKVRELCTESADEEDDEDLI